MPPPSEPAGPSRFQPAREAEKTRCGSCRQLYPHSALDQRLWCPECRGRLERLTRLGKHGAALLVTLPAAGWIVAEGRFGTLPLWAWLLPLAVAYYLGYRIGGELVRGFVQWRRARESENEGDGSTR